MTITKRDDEYMAKQVTFSEKDADLVKDIVAFQKAHELPSFVEAVRRLCRNGLYMNDVVKSLK